MCGDAWNSAEPRDHELGGRYTSAIIVRRYRPGHKLRVVVELTAAHGGYFEFRVCPVKHHPTTNSTPEPRDPSPDCLDRNVLQIVSESSGHSGITSSTRYIVGPRADRMHAVDVQLPPGLQCEHCLFQWKYHTGKRITYDHNLNCAVMQCAQFVLSRRNAVIVDVAKYLNTIVFKWYLNTTSGI